MGWAHHGRTQMGMKMSEANAEWHSSFTSLTKWSHEAHVSSIRFTGPLFILHIFLSIFHLLPLPLQWGRFLDSLLTFGQHSEKTRKKAGNGLLESLGIFLPGHLWEEHSSTHPCCCEQRHFEPYHHTLAFPLQM